MEHWVTASAEPDTEKPDVMSGFLLFTSGSQLKLLVQAHHCET